MRIRRALSLMLLAAVSSCGDGGGPEPDGTLLVSTSTAGTEPDRDGYVLTLDGADPVALEPADTAQIGASSGSHLLRLLGVAEHCVVAPGAQLEVDVLPQSMTEVAFEVTCTETAARITVVTTGVDRDANGYRVVVDGTDRGPAPINGTVLTRLAAGPHTIALQGLAANCGLDGQSSHTVAIGPSQVLAVEFAVVCNATTGVIEVSLATGAEEGAYEARVDGGSPYPLGTSQPAYVIGMLPGSHTVALTAPEECTIENPTQSVTVRVGTPVRDTAEATFTVRCEPTRFRITVPTTGPIPNGPFSVWLCDTSWYCYYNGPYPLGSVFPNDTLVAPVVAAAHLAYYVELRDVPENCRVDGRNPTDPIAPTAGDTTDIAFPVRCSP
jgi:hypothetical protein